MIRNLRTISPAFLLFACSSIPDQSQLTNVDTVSIIRQIMCEVKDELTNDPILRTQTQFALALRFDFQTLNQNDKDGDVKVTLPVAWGTVSVGLDKGGVQDRNFAEDVINISNTFAQYRTLPCDELDNAHLAESESRGILPITGRVKIGDVLRRYFELKRFSKSGKIDPFNRTLRFNVAIQGGVKTTIVLSNSDGSRINANNTLSARRTDQHEVIISISPIKGKPTPEEVIASRTYYIVQLPDKKAADRQLAPLTTGPSAAEVGAIRAGQQAEDQFGLNQLREINRRLQTDIFPP